MRRMQVNSVCKSVRGLSVQDGFGEFRAPRMFTCKSSAEKEFRSIGCPKKKGKEGGGKSAHVARAFPIPFWRGGGAELGGRWLDIAFPVLAGERRRPELARAG
jgi:hypothetical protein